MAKFALPLALSVAAVAVAGVAFSGVTDELAPKVTRSGAVAVVRDVCLAQASRRAVLREARRTAGETVRADALPAPLHGAGEGDWQVVKRVSLDGRPAFLTVGDRGGISMCRVYFQQDDVQAMAGALPGQIVLGAPLGRPDDAGVQTRPEGWPFVGWHVSRKGGWSSVFYAHDPRSAWRTVEVTRGE